MTLYIPLDHLSLTVLKAHAGPLDNPWVWTIRPMRRTRVNLFLEKDIYFSSRLTPAMQEPLLCIVNIFVPEYHIKLAKYFMRA